ncbi:MAG: hypothetical protein KKE30_11270 [Gammaproteobacteria bacterium]|nr:hypothetical protein [Gammaproteobacteria bacterium]MBU1556065.1 hypothetical protein [Gammaproteobacteria bacterium]MBU2070279.1 hypothetical protein [Gammaproteobacteria bacterium]MBU2183982.1 hypothetical protein [Gammaproteobacteria bacterium]MBU2206786.1 hypothetical protein [Gammaproteobacteria bacterium]
MSSIPFSVVKAQLFREAMKTYIREQAARSLAVLGGTTPEMPQPKRRFNREYKQHD